VAHPQNFSPGQFESLINRCPHSVYRPSDSSVAPCSLCLCAVHPTESDPLKKNKKRIAQILAEQRAEPTVKIEEPSEESDDDQEELSEEFEESAIEEDEEIEDD